jgi:hypothetical protein
MSPADRIRPRISPRDTTASATRRSSAWWSATPRVLSFGAGEDRRALRRHRRDPAPLRVCPAYGDLRASRGRRSPLPPSREAVAQARGVVPPPQMSPGVRERDLMGGRLAASEAFLHPICPDVVDGHWYAGTNNFRRVGFVRRPHAKGAASRASRSGGQSESATCSCWRPRTGAAPAAPARSQMGECDRTTFSRGQTRPFVAMGCRSSRTARKRSIALAVSAHAVRRGRTSACRRL